MLEPLKGLFRGSLGRTTGGGLFLPGGGVKVPLNGRGAVEPASLSSRKSRGLEEFFVQIRDTSGLTILDLGGATQKNVSFITDLGHRLYSEDSSRSCALFDNQRGKCVWCDVRLVEQRQRDI